MIISFLVWVNGCLFAEYRVNRGLCGVMAGFVCYFPAVLASFDKAERDKGSGEYGQQAACG